MYLANFPTQTNGFFPASSRLQEVSLLLSNRVKFDRDRRAVSGKAATSEKLGFAPSRPFLRLFHEIWEETRDFAAAETQQSKKKLSYTFTDQLLPFLIGGCLRFPVGITDSFIIPDDSISAPNFFQNFEATKVRMSDGAAWCLPDGQSGSLEVDFGEDVLVCAVETRGFNNSGNPLYPYEFELSFSADGSSFTKYAELVDSLSRVRTCNASIHHGRIWKGEQSFHLW